MLEEGKGVIIDDETIQLKAAENDMTAITVVDEIIITTVPEPVKTTATIP